MKLKEKTMNKFANGWYDGKFFVNSVLVGRVSSEFTPKGNFKATFIDMGMEYHEYSDTYTGAKTLIEEKWASQEGK